MLRITVENEPIVESPSLDQLCAVVHRMTPNGGPSFAVLDGRGDDYAQIAGGDSVFTAEWRDYTAGGFRHWKAGVPGKPTDGYAAVPTNGFHVSIHPNEQLTGSDAVAILGAFLAGEGRPSRYVWREMQLQRPQHGPAVRKVGEHHYELPCRECGEIAVVIRRGPRDSIWGTGGRPDRAPDLLWGELGRQYLLYRGITHEPLPGLDASHCERISGWLDTGDVATVHEYLKQIDVRMEDGIDAYCPECDAIYCATHYHTRVEFDDGFYDCTNGTCPHGHTRILDD